MTILLLLLSFLWGFLVGEWFGFWRGRDEERCQTIYKTDSKPSDFWKMPAYTMWANRENWLKGKRQS